MEEDDIEELEMELERNLGKEAADRFIDHYSGTNLYTPKRIKTRRKHRKIKKEFKNGASYRELALRYKYTERHVRNIIHGRRFRGSSNKNT